MQSKTTQAYNALFGLMKQRGLELRQVLVDMEGTQMRALRETFGEDPNFSATVCYFHVIKVFLTFISQSTGGHYIACQ